MAVDKSVFIKIIKEEFPGISDEGIKAIMVNVSVETGKGTTFTEYSYKMAGNNGIFTQVNGKYKHPIKSARKHMRSKTWYVYAKRRSKGKIQSFE